MMAAPAVVLTAIVYLCGLFAVAHWGDGRGRRFVRGGMRANVYALALAVYCTSWTFYGSVGLASHSGLDFLTVYVGPVLVYGLGHRLVGRVLAIAKAQNSTSVADFVAARYGKSELVAALVTLVAAIGTLPYIALQLKAVSASLEVLLNAGGASNAGVPFFEDLALVVALVMAGFALAFGTRSSAATEHQPGLILAIAAESLVKLAAFLAVGLAVVLAWPGGAGPVALAARIPDIVGRTSGPATLAALSLLSAAVALLLPRQFYVAIVENRDPGDVRRAAWLFPLYLVGINLLVVPLAAAGLDAMPGPSADRDMTVLQLPLAGGMGFAALVAFVGGLSAATAMVIAETVAVSIMITGHLVVPLLLRVGARPADPARPGGLEPVVLHVRRLAVVAVTLLGYAYYRVAGGDALAAIGFLSFAAIAQIAPAFFAGLVWRRGTALGAATGLASGLAVWTYTLLVPALLDDDAPFLAAGPFGIGWLRPTALFGASLDQLAHGTLWSLGVNLAAYLGASLLRRPGAAERLQAGAFLLAPGSVAAPTVQPARTAGVPVDELRAAVARFLGADLTARSFASFARSRGGLPDGGAPADAELLRYAEHILASAIGASSARLALSLLLRRQPVSGPDAMRLLDEASSAIQQNRDLLQHALDHARQGINVLDADLRLLCWNASFVELYDFPPELVRIGVGLDEIVRVNAGRGVYGPGTADALADARLRDLVEDTGPHRIRLATSGRVISTRTSRLPGGGLFITYTDVTELADREERRERETEDLEERVRARTEELTTLNAALTRAKREADDANASKTRFLAAASHDILQPLNAARLYATALVERNRGAEVAGLADNIDASLEAVEEIITTLLDISRLDAGGFTPRVTTVAAADLFRQLSREFAPAASAKGLRLRFASTSLVVRTDRALLRRLLRNLLSNAVKYTPSGTVLVGARPAGPGVRLEVRDTGLGIPAAEQTLVFREFRRLPEGARAAGGLGLGLSIVERIARTLDAPLTLRSEPGRGSVFAVTLPRAGGAPAEPASPAEPTRAAGGRLDGLVVLALDNEPAVLDGMKALLAGWGCDVRVAGSLDEAREACAAGRLPDVIVADYQLTGENGLSAIDALRAEAGSAVPAVLATADRSAILREEAAARGVVILNKPLKPAALRAVLTRSRPPPRASV